MKFDVKKAREDFPILKTELKCGHPLVYFDNSATSQKPLSVVEAVSDFYLRYNSNIHRSAHELSENATRAYENAREKIQSFFKADDSYSTIFTRGATESLNMVAQVWGGSNLKPGDEIILSEAEHHANIVPWQIVSEKTGAKIKVAKIREDGSFDFEHFLSLLGKRVKVVSVAHAYNVLGSVNDVKKIAAAAKECGALVSVDAAQSAPHWLDALSGEIDFLSVSAHKCYGPTGIGVLVGKRELLDSMPPWQGGGDMIENVSWEKTTFRASPARFEAGTPDIAGAIGFGAAVDYMNSIDSEGAKLHENELLARLADALSEIKGLRIFGWAKGKLPIVSFACDGIHQNDISTFLNTQGIAIRSGHHCAEPLMKTLGVSGTCRASLAFYNTAEEVDIFAEKLSRAVKLLS